MDSIIMLMTTESEDQAKALINAVLGDKLAAGVNMISGARTYYWFENEINESHEIILMFRTDTTCIDSIKIRVIKINPEVEISVMKVQQYNDSYLSWIKSVTTKDSF